MDFIIALAIIRYPLHHGLCLLPISLQHEQVICVSSDVKPARGSPWKASAPNSPHSSRFYGASRGITNRIHVDSVLYMTNRRFGIDVYFHFFMDRSFLVETMSRT